MLMTTMISKPNISSVMLRQRNAPRQRVKRETLEEQSPKNDLEMNSNQKILIRVARLLLNLDTIMYKRALEMIAMTEYGITAEAEADLQTLDIDE